MGRGKPFVQPATRLLRRSGRDGRQPSWMAAVNMTPPQFEPVTKTKPTRITYPEDAFRETFLKRNPHARRIPVNLMASAIPERHIADRFVMLQMRIMRDDKLSEEKAYEKADRIICSEIIEATRGSQEEGDFSTLIDPTIEDKQARLYIASLRDCQRDKMLHRAFVKEKKGK